jgi:amidophosphoribosyltransferase
MKIDNFEDKPRENCAVIGVFNHPAAARLAYQGLFALQHRGQESSGITSSDGENLYKHIGQGLVSDVFSNLDVFHRLKGSLAIGHNRYSTTGASEIANGQPLVVNSKNGPLAIAHNGNIVNSYELRSALEAEGSLFQTTTDTEVVLHLIARSQENTLMGRLKDALNQVQGAFSFVLLTRHKIIAIRDPYGFRPLALGRRGDTWLVASETCAFDLIGAEFIREIEPGEILIIDKMGLKTDYLATKVAPRMCIFEFIYFSRPDSFIFGHMVDKVRRKFGRRLALEQPAESDIVISVPDSSNTAALGYSNTSGIKFEIGLIRNHYIGRTFILPEQSERDFRVRVKFNPIQGVIQGRRIVMVEDSIVRGTTLKKLTKLIRNAGAKEIHIRVSSPPIRYPCYYGMDFPTQGELIAYNNSIEDIRRFLEVDSLGYLSLEGLLASVPDTTNCFCSACFDGNYPILPESQSQKLKMRQNIITSNSH